jgi:hypothetical protein
MGMHAAVLDTEVQAVPVSGCFQYPGIGGVPMLLSHAHVVSVHGNGAAGAKIQWWVRMHLC